MKQAAQVIVCLSFVGKVTAIMVQDTAQHQTEYLKCCSMKILLDRLIFVLYNKMVQYLAGMLQGPQTVLTGWLDDL